MKKKQARFCSLQTGMAFFAVVFACFALLSPAVFAQQSDTDSEKTLLSRRYLELINSVFSFVQQNYVDEVDPEILYAGAMKGIMESLGDPYTVYMDKNQMRSMSDTTVGSFGGVGLSITKAAVSTPDKPAYVEVVSPIEDTPGWKAGIQSGDLLIGIDGVSTADITMDEVLEKLRGKIGTAVEVTVRRGKSNEFTVSLVRALIEVPCVKYGIIAGRGNNIGYLRIIEFTPQTPERVQQALDSFKAQNFGGLIIDLRNNPGGLITSVADVADKFIDSGTIVSTKSRLMYENSVYTASSRSTTMPSDIPIVVLINRGSASASEILAGALKDNHLAYLVGERTYGKGSVQQVVPLPNHDGIKLTMARYYTPSDTNIDKIGIPPDLELLMPELSEDEEKVWIQLMNDRTIASYIEEHHAMTEKDISAYTQKLGKTYALNPLYLRRLIKLEVYKTREQPLYDLDFDLQLVKAIDIIQGGKFRNLVRATKTLRELQDKASSELNEENIDVPAASAGKKR
ncbi:MAG: S41 family peptidase [Bacteroides sp.]|nr:S41 family peptidase [Prevotella sp.]MCM1408444.1 S41 family peptidase [Treponema brennaborense]MCM1469394.1 S41 family peptidase [Bacteroides sp.]